MLLRRKSGSFFSEPCLLFKTTLFCKDSLFFLFLGFEFGFKCLLFESLFLSDT
jgi:hypothetical protein